MPMLATISQLSCTVILWDRGCFPRLISGNKEAQRYRAHFWFHNPSVLWGMTEALRALPLYVLNVH